MPIPKLSPFPYWMDRYTSVTGFVKWKFGMTKSINGATKKKISAVAAIHPAIEPKRKAVRIKAEHATSSKIVKIDH